MVTIALDAMSGDHGSRIVVPSALQILDQYPQTKLILVGDAPALNQRLAASKRFVSDRLVVHHASQIVAMDEAPAQVLRNKKDSSMRVAINLVKEGLADACVSAGNTGALMVTARFVLGTLPGIDRPAIISRMPSQWQQGCYMLDLGANVDCTPFHLYGFAVMAATLVSGLRAKPHPTVALLNIGTEDIKGNELVKKTAELLQRSSVINYAGYIEAHQIFTTDIDVVVCDGFMGNVALKTMEGVAKLIADIIRESFKKTAMTRLIAAIAAPVLRRLRKRLDPARYNGATLLGLKGIVVKSHGHTTVSGFARAIEEAISQVNSNALQRIHQELLQIANKENDA